MVPPFQFVELAAPMTILSAHPPRLESLRPRALDVRSSVVELVLGFPSVRHLHPRMIARTAEAITWIDKGLARMGLHPDPFTPPERAESTKLWPRLTRDEWEAWALTIRALRGELLDISRAVRHAPGCTNTDARPWREAAELGLARAWMSTLAARHVAGWHDADSMFYGVGDDDDD